MKLKWKISKNVSKAFKLSENRRNWKFHILPFILLFVRTHNSIYRFSSEAWKLHEYHVTMLKVTLKIRKLEKIEWYCKTSQILGKEKKVAKINV